MPETAANKFRFTVKFSDDEFISIAEVDKEFLSDNGEVLMVKKLQGWEILNSMEVNRQKDMEMPDPDDEMFMMGGDTSKDNNGWEYSKDEQGNQQRCRMKPKMGGDDFLDKEKDDMEDMAKKMKHVISECSPSDEDSCGADHKCGMATSSNEKYNQVLETIGWHCYKQIFCGKELDGVRLDCNGYMEEDMEKEPHQKEEEDANERARKEQVEYMREQQKIAIKEHEEKVREQQVEQAEEKSKSFKDKAKDVFRKVSDKFVKRKDKEEKDKGPSMWDRFKCLFSSKC